MSEKIKHVRLGRGREPASKVYEVGLGCGAAIAAVLVRADNAEEAEFMAHESALQGSPKVRWSIHTPGEPEEWSNDVIPDEGEEIEIIGSREHDGSVSDKFPMFVVAITDFVATIVEDSS